ncbi:hypothetical protein ACFONN_07005 [Dyella humi]|uniref:Uncharacterized protein n=1 Tax=Dyella humi TaxID=1770547 RepID=A0ABW8II49_9GAMM
MRTPKLLIVAIRGNRGVDEVNRSANGIYNKYSNRTEFNKQVELAYLSRSGNLVEGEGKGALDLNEGDVLGMYIVAHSGDLQTAIYDHDFVSAFKTKILDVKSNGVNYTLDKLCLVVCNTAKGAEDILTNSHEGVLIFRFAKLLQSAGLKPRLAGWSGLVTADEESGYANSTQRGTGKKQIISSRNFQWGYASEMPRSKAEQKMVYVWDDEAGYVKRDLRSWTDKG